MDQIDQFKRSAAAEELGVSAEELAAWTAEASGEGEAESAAAADGDAQEDDSQDGISEEARTRLEDIVMMGFDAGKDQLDALADGSIDGLVVQNPFGMGYAAVVAAARTVLEIGNEAQVDTGFVWVDADNMEDENVQPMLYE